MTALLSTVECAVAGTPEGALKVYAKKRSWSDTSGKFKVEGELNYADKQDVHLRKSDGQILKIPLAKLAEADRTFVESFLEAESLSADSPDGSPFTAIGSSPSPTELNGSKTPNAPKLAIPRGRNRSEPQPEAVKSSIQKRNVSNSGTKILPIQYSKAEWQPVAVAPLPRFDIEDQTHTLSFAKDFFAGMRMLAAGASGTVVTNVCQPGNSKFSVVRIKGEDQLPMLELTEPWNLMAVSPDGRRFAAVRVDTHGRGSDVAIFSITKNGIHPEFQFTAGSGDWGELFWVGFASSDRLITLTYSQKLTFWDLSNASQVKALSQGVTGHAIANLNASGELLAIASGKAIAIIDTKQMKQVGCLIQDEGIQHMAFSPDGKRLATFAPFSVSVFDLKEGKLETKITGPESLGWAGMGFLGNNYLLAGNLMLDIDQAKPVWTYAIRTDYRAMLGNVLVTAFERANPLQLTVLNLPDDETKKTIARDEKSETYAVIPGDAVSVSFELNGISESASQSIRETITQKIEQAGWTIRPQSNKQIRVSITQGEEKSEDYYTSASRSGAGPDYSSTRGDGPKEVIRYRPWNQDFIIMANGEEVYKLQTQIGSPRSLNTNPGESTQEAISRLLVPQPEFFTKVTFPKRVLSAKYREGLGKTVIDSRGLQK